MVVWRENCNANVFAQQNNVTVHQTFAIGVDQPVCIFEGNQLHWVFEIASDLPVFHR